MNAEHLCKVLTNRGKVVLTPLCLRVLLAMDSIMKEGGSPTIRQISRRVGGCRNTGGVHPILCRLVDAGLIAWVRGKHGTLRFTCKLEIL